MTDQRTTALAALSTSEGGRRDVAELSVQAVQKPTVEPQSRIFEQRIAALAEGLEYGHPSKSYLTRFRCVINYGKPMIQIPFEGVAELNPAFVCDFFVNHVDKAGQPRYLTGKENRSRYVGGKNCADIGKFAQINFGTLQKTEIVNQGVCSDLQILVGFQSDASSASFFGGLSEGIGFSEFSDSVCSARKILDIGGRKNCTYSSTREVSPCCGCQQRSKDAKHSSDTCPGVPVYSACFAQPPTLTYTIEQAHSLIPLWTYRHFATTRGRERLATLATVKPPRDRRTRLRPDTEHKDCSHG